MSDQQDQKSKKQAASFDVNRALTRALGGGLAGASAMVVQVVTLMVCCI